MPDTQLRREDPRGDWILLEWVQRYDDGRAVYPLGRSPAGRLHYGEQRVTIMIVAGDRPRFATGGQWTADAAEKAAAYDGFLAYSGTYDLDGETVRHHVDLSLYPDWSGGTQTRRATISGDRLDLIARLEVETAEARTAVLSWRRARD